MIINIIYIVLYIILYIQYFISNMIIHITCNFLYTILYIQYYYTEYMLWSWGARAKRAFFPLVFQGREKKSRHNGSYEHRVPKIKNKTFFCTMCVWFNIVFGHLGRPYSTHTAPIAVPTGSMHAHILTSPTCAITWYVVQSWWKQNLDAETCVFTGRVTQAGPRFCDFQKFKKMINGFVFLYLVQVPV